MLFQFEVENFFSIRDRQKIDLLISKGLSNEDNAFGAIGPGSDERAPKVVALFGPNAAGKSNFLKALSFLVWFARDSFRLPPGSTLPFLRFHDASGPFSKTYLSAAFAGPSDLGLIGTELSEPCEWKYEVSITPTKNSEQAITETLSYVPLPHRRRIILLQREPDSTVTAHKRFKFKSHHEVVRDVLLPNSSVLSTLAQLKHPVALALRQMLSQIGTNILLDKFEPSDSSTVSLYGRNPHLMENLNAEIEKLDLGIQSVNISNNGSEPFFEFHHRGLEAPLKWSFESHGTRHFIKMLPYLLEALRLGSVAIIDELDSSIHPTLLPEIIRWFHSSERNPLNAQLWMSCQNPALLEYLSKEEIFFCEKDHKGSSQIFGLKDVLGVRRIDNYSKKYLSGIYGAVPKLG